MGAIGVRITIGAVSHFVGAPGQLKAIGLADGSEIVSDTAFISPRARPNDRLLEALGCERDVTTGLIGVDNFGQTSTPGVWAAGNVVTPTAQVITAAGAGSASAISIRGWLLQQDLDAATAARE